MAQQHTPAAGSSTKVEAVLQECGDRIHFLQSTDEDGHTRTEAPLGFHQVAHSVIVFSRAINHRTEHLPTDVTLCLRTAGMSVHESLTPEEARILASALNRAAGIADIENSLATAKAMQVAA